MCVSVFPGWLLACSAQLCSALLHLCRAIDGNSGRALAERLPVPAARSLCSAGRPTLSVGAPHATGCGRRASGSINLGTSWHYSTRASYGFWPIFYCVDQIKGLSPSSSCAWPAQTEAERLPSHGKDDALPPRESATLCLGALTL